MQIVLKDGYVVATHRDDQDIRDKYPGCELAWTAQAIIQKEDGSFPDDPRTENEKACSYKHKRKLAYPSIEDQLDMLYWDKRNGTLNWYNMVTETKKKFPKP